MSATYEKAMLLFEQKRYEPALQKLQEVLAQTPDDPRVLGHTALCLARLERYEEAAESAGHAISAAPDLGFAHYVAGMVSEMRNRHREAEKHIQNALQLEPENTAFLAAAADYRNRRRDWNQALVLAQKCLEIDPDNALGGHARAMALVSLGRIDEARDFIGKALEKAPESPLFQAHRGWNALQSGDREAATDAFLEALRLDPEMAWAREGLVEALKLRYPLYAFVLKRLLRMQRRGAGEHAAYVVGEILAMELLEKLVRRYRRLRALLNLLVLLRIARVVLSWTARPLTNLALRLHTVGNASLSDDQRAESSYAGIAAAAAAGALAMSLTTHVAAWSFTSVLSVFMLLNVAATFKCQRGWTRSLVGGISIAALLIGLFGLYRLFDWERDYTGLGAFFMAANLSVVNSYLGNFLEHILPDGALPPRRKS